MYAESALFGAFSSFFGFAAFLVLARGFVSAFGILYFPISRSLVSTVIVAVLSLRSRTRVAFITLVHKYIKR